MSCIPCFLTKAIPTCIEQLTIGEVEPSTNYDVYLVNNNTGYIIKRAITSDVDGLLIVDLTEIDSSFFSPSFKYKIHACLAGDPIGSAVDIIAEGMEEAVQCLLVPVVRVFGEPQESSILEIDSSCDCE